MSSPVISVMQIGLSLLFTVCLLALSGCSQSSVQDGRGREGLTLTSYRPTSSQPFRQIDSLQELKASENALQKQINSDEHQVLETRREIANFNQSLADKLSVLGTVVTYLGQDVVLGNKVPEATLSSSVSVAREWIENKQREIDLLRKAAVQIEPAARRAADIYLESNYSEIDLGVKRRNQMRKKIGARPSDQAEAQARARKQLQARVSAQSQYATSVQSQLAANHNRQEVLRADINTLQQYVQVINCCPAEIDKLESDIVAAERKLNGLNVAISDSRSRLMRIQQEVAVRMKAEREQLAKQLAMQREHSQKNQPRKTTLVTTSSNLRKSADTHSNRSTGGFSSSRLTGSYGYSRSQSSSGYGSRRYDPSYRPAPKEQYIKGYTRTDGTEVKGHMRTVKDGSFFNNWTTHGNTNPYTGRSGTRLPPYSSN